LNERIQAYGAWRARIDEVLRRHAHWSETESTFDPAQRERLTALRQRLADERMTVAFVAEFSRGKSELINALFLADYGQRVLPSAAGRTTMCPTELMYDPDQPPGIRLLPIETRLRDTPLSVLRAQHQEWITVPFDPDDVASVRLAFECVRETRKVSLADAVLMGLFDDAQPGTPLGRDADDRVEVSRWRHAVANLPHPLLRMGLVVVDTPGLNALGAEPELTLNLLPSAHAVVFILAADAGVSRTDVEVWRERISPTHASGRFVVLNKIDGLWDPLRTPEQIDAEIDAQVATVAQTLKLPTTRVFPLSAQKGLVARITRDPELLAHSRLAAFERALWHEIVPQRQSLLSEQVRLECDAVFDAQQAMLDTRRRGVVEQIFELQSLRGRNRLAIEQTARRIRHERADFDRSLQRLKALRVVFQRHDAAIRQRVHLSQLKTHVREARRRMRASRLSSGLREAMEALMQSARLDFIELERLVNEMQALMGAMYQQFGREHGLALGAPATFSLQRYVAEIDRISAYQQRHFGAMSLVTTEKWALTRRYFETVAVRVRAVYEVADRSAQHWLAALLTPIESQIREHQGQLRQRLDSIQRILDAGGALQVRIDQLEDERSRLDAQATELARLGADLSAALTAAAPQHRQQLTA
jgi:hypothetical protein